jgi:hypothetical protein
MATQKPNSRIRVADSTCLNTDADLSWSWLWQRSLHETQHTRTRNFNGCVCRAHIRYAHSDLRSIRCFNANTIVGQAFVPPSTVRFAPVMYEDSGLATNATNAATSSTCP